METVSPLWLLGTSNVASATEELNLLLLFSLQSYPTLCDTMDCSTPVFPVLHHLLEFAQAHVY